MSFLLESALRLRGRMIAHDFDRAAAAPAAAQWAFLARHVRANAGTAFGQEHDFAAIGSIADYQRRVPVRDYEGHRRYLDVLRAGATRVLTEEAPVMYATTSGTTDRPKHVPVTASWLRDLKRLTTLWLYRALRDHPDLYGGRMLSLTSPAVEGRDVAGTPVGSVSGLTYRRAPALVRRTYAMPYEVSEIADYDHRYLAAATFMFAADVSLAVAPNPSTFLRLAREGRWHGERIVRAVRDGRLERPDSVPARDWALYERLDAQLAADRSRAAVLERCLERHGRLVPREVWSNLALMGVWLGGSAGVQADRLLDPYGGGPRRDLGIRATEATLTVPFADDTASGPLAVATGFWEFIPEGSVGDTDPPIRLAHELELGQRYYVILTTSGGLYRYDINDIVEVQGFHRATPCLAFVRKGRDMVSLTGEKLHAAQVGEAAERAARELGLLSAQVQLIPDAGRMRYDLLVEARVGLDGNESELARRVDAHLAELNVEYREKRGSERLDPPHLVRMRPGWAARRQARDVAEGGKRDGQYKWPFIQNEWDEAGRAEREEREDETPAGTPGATKS